MKSIDVHELIINKDSYDILSADTEFYSFMGERLYYTFNRLVLESDMAALNRHIEEHDEKRFALRLMDEDGGIVHCFAKVMLCEAKGCVQIRLIQTEDLVESELQLKQALNIRNRLLGLYNDDYFEYYADKNIIKIYSINIFEQEIAVVSLEEFEKNMYSHADEEALEEINELMAALRSGNRSFELCVSRNLINDDENVAVTTIRGLSLYENGEYTMAVGYIHLGNERSQSAGKRIEVDSLTGVMPKADITNSAISMIDIKKIKGIAIAIVDIDYFKNVNDTYGHMVGDEVLKRVAEIISREVNDNGLVGRIGGDEFFIIFYDVEDMENARERLRSIKNIVNASFPPNEDGKPSITLSIGCAAYPKDADNYEDLFTLADFALYRAKEKGRNRYIIFDENKHGSLKEIKNMKMTEKRINNRGDMSMGDILCVMMDKVNSSGDYPVERLLEDVVENFDIQRIMLYAGMPPTVVEMVGEKRPSQEIIQETQMYINNDAFIQMYDKNGMLVVDDISIFSGRNEMVYSLLQRQEVLSFIQFRTTDRNGNPVVLSLESVSRRITWNRSHLHYYRLLAGLFSKYVL